MPEYTITRTDTAGNETRRYADSPTDAAMMHAMLESLPSTASVTTTDSYSNAPQLFEVKHAEAPRPSRSEPSALEVQVGGGHYKDMKIQPVEFIHANGIPFIEGCVIKYVARWRTKGGVKDLEKARHFIDLLIELEE